MTGTEALLECGAAVLPISVRDSARHFGVKTVEYTDFIELYNIDKQDIYKKISYGGFSLLLDGTYVCVLNNSLCGKARRKWTAAHELGHILLGHVSDSRDNISISDERSADRFAADFLAPLTVLHFCGVSSAAEIERLCGISHQAAEYRFNELVKKRRSQEKYFRQSKHTEYPDASKMPECDSLFDSSDEFSLLMKFMPFISRYISRRSEHDGYENYLRQLSG